MKSTITTTTTKTFKTSPPNLTTIPSMFYEPTSVLDPHLTSSPASLPTTTTTTTTTTSSIPIPPPSDDWDPLSFFDPNSVDDDPFLDLPSLDILPNIPPPPQLPPSFPSFDRPHLDLLLKAASAIESNDVSTAHLLLSRLNHLNFGSSALQRAAFHFTDALLSLLPIPNPPTSSPPLSPLEIVNRITAQKSFSDLSPIPHFTSFTANQTILEALLNSNTNHQFIHIIDFDIGLGGQWSSFVQEIAARSKSLRSPTPTPPQIRITAIVPDETIETVLAAENLKEYASAVGIHLSVSFIHVGNLGTLALSRVRINSGEAIGMVLTPTIFRLVGSSPESTSALLRFIRQVSPRILVFVDGECIGCNSASSSSSFRRSFALGLEFYSSVLESLDAAAAAAAVQEEEEEPEEVVRRVEMGVVRPRIFGAVEGWAPREMTWREVLAGGGMTEVGFSEFTECQAEWLVRRAPVEGFQVARREGAMMLTWRGRELASTSAWRC